MCSSACCQPASRCSAGWEQRHAVRLGLGHGAAVHAGRRQAGGSLVLGLGDVGGKFQIIGNRVASGQLAQPCGPVAKQAAHLGGQHAGERDVVQRLDIAGLQDAS